MENKIIHAYPEVSDLYLRRGQGSPLRIENSQIKYNNNIIEEIITIQELLSLPIKILEPMIYDLKNEIDNFKRGN